tara:strand:+ start:209 stop:847 length:639 start_codon:yes stop_codon:yes gene_type:complete
MLNIVLNNNALLIQKNYRRYYVNKKVRNIYVYLPDDVQYLIKKYMNLDIYYKKFKRTLRNVCDNKLFNTIHDITYYSLITYTLPHNNMRVIENNINTYTFSDKINLLEYLYNNKNYITFIVYFYEKYKMIISYDIKNKFNILMFTYTLLFNNLLCSDEYNDYICTITNNILSNNYNNQNQNQNQIFSDTYKEIIKDLFDLYNNYLMKYIIVF